MDKFPFSPDPLFFTVEFETRKVKATERMLNKLYEAGYLGLRKDEQLATFAGMTLSEFNTIRANDPLVDRAVFMGRTDSEARTSMKLLERVEEGDVKAIQLKLTHQHDWMPAKPANDTDNTVTIRVVNAEPDPME